MSDKERIPDKADPMRQLADVLRGHAGLPHGSGKLEAAAGHADRVEYFRAKDLVAYAREHPQRLSVALSSGSGRSPDEAARDVLSGLLRRRLVLACGRKYKKPRPGKKKLVKWPKTLLPAGPGGEPLPLLDEEAFYAWTYDKPAGPLFFLLSGLAAVCVIGVCLFPLAPYNVRIGVMYCLTGLLAALLAALLARYALWLSLWCVTGHSLWLLPNILSDDVPVSEALAPLVTFTRADSWRVNAPARLAAAAAAAGLAFLLYRHHPEVEDLTAGVHSAHDTIASLLEALGAAKPGLTDATAGRSAAFTAGNAGQPQEL